MRILLVEDDKRLGRSVTRGLQEEGYTVDHAEDGPEAQLLVDTRPYEVIVLDRMLPGISGDQLLAGRAGRFALHGARPATGALAGAGGR